MTDRPTDRDSNLITVSIILASMLCPTSASFQPNPFTSQVENRASRRRDGSHETSKEHRQQAGLEPALQSPRQGLSITWAAGQQVLCPSSHGESQIPDPRDVSSSPPVSSEKGLSSSYHPVRSWAFARLLWPKMSSGELTPRDSLHPVSLPELPACCLPFTHPLLSPSSAQTAGWRPFPIT